MKFLSSEKLSAHKYKTPEGYLICTDAILARTGKQQYRKSEVFADCNDDSIIDIDRTPEEVFSPTTLASFENKPITVEHPNENVTVDNHNSLSVGFVRDVRRGMSNGQEVMLGNLVITDKQTIEEIERGEHTDLSCGYDCDIQDEANPQQRNIRGNHVALCQEGRAGIARIVDSVKDSIESDFAYITNMSDAKIVLQKYGIELVKKDNKNYILRKNGKEYTFYVLDNPNEVRKDLARAVHKLTDSIKDAKPDKPEFPAKGKWEWDEAQYDWYDTGRGAYYEEIKREHSIVDNNIKDSKYVVHFKGQNGAENKDVVVDAHGMTEAVQIAKTYVSDYYWKYTSVELYEDISMNDAIDNINKEQIINIAKSRGFELRRMQPHILSFVYKGNNMHKDVTEIIKVLPQYASADWDNDNLDISFRDSLKDSEYDDIISRARQDLRHSNNKEATLLGIIGEIEDYIQRLPERERARNKQFARAGVESLKKEFNLSHMRQTVDSLKKYEASYVDSKGETHIHLIKAKSLDEALKTIKRRQNND